MFGPRPSASPVILEVSELTEGDLELQPIRVPALKEMKDSHHMLARLFALGHGTTEVAKMAGYSISRVSILRNDQAFSELVAQYKIMVDQQMVDSVDEYFELASAARIKSMRLINDKLDGNEADDISIRELVTIHADAADRTGYPKRSVAVNVNVDFAARLDRAIIASAKAKLIEPSSPQIAGPHLPADRVREGGEALSPPSPFRRRVA